MTETILIQPEQNSVHTVESRLQRMFFFEDTEKGTLDLGKKIQSLNGPGTNQSYPLPIHFEWQSKSGVNTLLISKDDSFANPLSYHTENNCLDVYNFETGCRYYWKVNDSECRSFEISYSKPRHIKIDGLYNVRDCGSWITKDKKRIKQGMIYRGVRMEDIITESGKEEFRRLGIKTELDLRQEEIGNIFESPIGPDVNYIQIPCKGYNEFFLPEERKYAKQIFELFADESAYPIYFHCYGGADRTGTVAFLLGAILGVDERTLIRDYEFTMISNKNDVPDMRRTRWGELFRRFTKEMNSGKYGKGTLCDKSMAALDACKINVKTIDTIREILLND